MQTPWCDGVPRRFTTRNIANALWGFARLDWKDEALYKEAADRAAAILSVRVPARITLFVASLACTLACDLAGCGYCASVMRIWVCVRGWPNLSR